MSELTSKREPMTYAKNTTAPGAGSILHKTPSVGTITKKLMAINPELSANDMIQIIRSCVHLQGAESGEFAGIEVLDEERAIAIARATLRQN